MNSIINITGDYTVFLSILVVALLSLVLTRKLLHVSFSFFLMGLLGLILGLWVGSFVSQPFSNVGGDIGRWLPPTIQIFIGVAVMDLFLVQAKPTARFLQLIFRRISVWALHEEMRAIGGLVVDTSVIIDARIIEIAKSGFLDLTLIVPGFVVDELQLLSDSSDDIKRAKGRRGLEALANLQNITHTIVIVTDDRLRGREKVDTKLVSIAKEKSAKILTIDYNLSRVAMISGVEVLNINLLANALRPVASPGERTQLYISQIGKEKGQGVGYLPDGTMIVIENGAKSVGKQVEIEVDHIYQTVAGKIIFAKIAK